MVHEKRLEFQDIRDEKRCRDGYGLIELKRDAYLILVLNQQLQPRAATGRALGRI